MWERMKQFERVMSTAFRLHAENDLHRCTQKKGTDFSVPFFNLITLFEDNYENKHYEKWDTEKQAPIINKFNHSSSSSFAQVEFSDPQKEIPNKDSVYVRTLQ